MAALHLLLYALVAALYGIPFLPIAVARTGFDAAFGARVALPAVVLVAVVGLRSPARSLRGRLSAIWVQTGRDTLASLAPDDSARALTRLPDTPNDHPTDPDGVGFDSRAWIVSAHRC